MRLTFLQCGFWQYSATLTREHIQTGIMNVAPRKFL